MKTTCCFILWIFITLWNANAQEPVIQRLLEDLTETMKPEDDENNDYQEIIDNLTYLSQHPIPINTANKDKLLQLHFLNELQVNDLLDYRNRTGQIYSIYEMAAIQGFDYELLQKLEPFISFDLQESTSKYKKSDNDLIIRTTRSFSELGNNTESNYEGSMERYYLRYKQISNRYEYGMVAEKDPGEAFFSGSNKYGFDYMSAYANCNIGSSVKLFLGDYLVKFGQGLIASQGFSMGKSSEATKVFQYGQGIRSSSSTDENQFYRGGAANIKLGDFYFAPFFSLRQLDTHIDTVAGKPFFGTFQTSGYHRLSSEIAGKNALQQLVYGGSASYSFHRWTIGFTGIFTHFNAELKRSEELYQHFLWEGRQNLVGGMDWKGSIQNIFLFGEMAISPNKGKALVSGMLFKPAVNAEVSFVYRNINKTYFSFFSNAFTESSRTNDEHGLYIGIKYYPVSKVTFSGYVDVFRYNWIKYTTAAPSSGKELFANLAYTISDRSNITARFFQEDKEVKVNTLTSKYNLLQTINRYRLHFSQRINENITLGSRIEYMTLAKLSRESGLSIYQDINYKPVISKFTINGRFGFFKTDSYYTRIYAYENDLLYSFSIPSLYGKGIRTYINIKQSITEKLSLWYKAGVTVPVTTIKTEYQDEHNTKYELKVQLRYKF